MKIEWVRARAGHILTFFKSFRSILEQGPSAKWFRSRSFFLVSFRSVPFHFVLSRRMVFPFCSVPFLAFLFREWLHPSRSVLSIEWLLKPGYLPKKLKPVKNTRLFGVFHTSDPSLSRDNSSVVEVIVDDLITCLGPSFYMVKTWVYFMRWTRDFYMGKLFFSHLLLLHF